MAKIAKPGPHANSGNAVRTEPRFGGAPSLVTKQARHALGMEDAPHVQSGRRYASDGGEVLAAVEGFKGDGVGRCGARLCDGSRKRSRPISWSIVPACPVPERKAASREATA